MSVSPQVALRESIRKDAVEIQGNSCANPAVVVNTVMSGCVEPE